MKIYNVTRNTTIANRAIAADRFFTRLRGLLHRKSLGAGEALIISHCQSIHMFFMRFSIDAIFVDEKCEVVALVRKIKPFQMSPIFWKASFAVELPAGVIEASKTQAGDLIKIEDRLD